VIASYSLEYWRASHAVVGMAITRIVHEIDASMVMSINKEEPELVGILNKGIAAITKDELEPMYRRWFGPDYSDRVAAVRVRLNADERAWLVDHPVLRVGVDPRWAPVEFTDEAGVAKGMSLAYLERLGKMLGVRFEARPGLSWTTALSGLREREVDVLPAIAATPSLKQHMRFTESYLSLPAAIFSAADVAYLGGPEALKGKTVAVVRDDAVESWLRGNWPDLQLLSASDTYEALRSVAQGRAFAFIGNLVTTSYYIGESGPAQIRVAGETDFVYHLGMGVRGDWPILAGILQKGLDAIPANERDAIYREWISIRYQHRVDYSLLWYVLAAAALILLIFVYWNRRLAAEVGRRRRAEAAYREAKEAAEQANRAKSIFLANMSHELRTPLNAVLGFASLLHTTNLEDAKRGSYLEGLSTAGKSLLQLIDDLLELSKAVAGKLELHTKPVDLRAMVRELELMFGRPATAKGLQLIMAVADEVPQAVLLDEVRLRQILVNLIGNAVKFTDAGHVEVRIRGDAVAEGVFQLTLTVADTGNGIAPDQQEKIFEIYSHPAYPGMADNGGAGLGLSISRRLARLMGGDIRLDSAPARGSTFALTLPHVKAAERAALALQVHPVPDTALAFAPARILVADGDASNRRLLVGYIAPYGFDSVEAEDGEQVLQEVRNRVPALILMDSAMPVLNGLEATRVLKADPATAHIPVIAITAAVTKEAEQEIRSVCDAYLEKPVSRPELVSTLARYLPCSRELPGVPAAPTPPPRRSLAQPGKKWWLRLVQHTRTPGGLRRRPFH